MGVSSVGLRSGRPIVGGRLEATLALCGAATAVLVGADGSPFWRLVRSFAAIAATALGLAALNRAEGRGRGAVAVGLGIPAVAVGLGFAPHLVKGGPVAVRLATLVLLIGAVGLTAGGTALATRGHRWWIRGGVGAMVLWSVVTVAFVVGPAVAATNPPHATLGANPQRVGLDYEDVTLQTSDGVSLAAWFVPSANRAAVVLLHGAGSTRSNVLDEAAILADAGFGVLMVDARGHGHSGGQAMDFGWHGDADIEAATTWLAARPDVDPGRIGAVGMSMGGEEAIGATGTNDVLRAVVAEGATARTAGDEAWLSDRYGVRGLLTEQLEKTQDLITDVLTSASVPSSMRAAVSASDARYLLITGGNVQAELRAADHISSAAPDRVQVWTVPGADHTGGLETAPQDWSDRVVEFLNDALRGG
jgi:dienelactone hydrolase